MDIHVSETGDLTVIRVEGNCLRGAGEEFEMKVEALVNNGARKIVLDLEKCDYISSLDISMLIWTKKQVAESGGDIKIAGVNKLVDLMKRTGMDKIFEIHESVGDAVRAFAPEATGTGAARE